MKNYRLTQRGKIVFTGLFIAVIVALVLMVSYLNNKIDPVSKERMINTEEIEKSNESIENNEAMVEDDTMDNDDNEVKTSIVPSSEIESVTESSVDLTTGQDSQDASIDNEKSLDGENDINASEFQLLYTLYYAPDAYKLDKRANEILEKYYNLAIENESDIIIEGNYHMGKGYDEKMFWHLSYKRALCAKDYLIKKGIKESRITIIDNKNLKALNKDASDYEVGLNRRVDIYFKDFYKEVN